MANFNNFVGIDVAKADFDACFDENTESKKFNNTAPGINSFLRHLGKLNFQNQNTIIGVESTGSYHLRLCIQSSHLGFKIKVINPLIVKKYNQTNLRRVKNDQKDASLIRHCLTAGVGYEFSETPDTLLLKCLVRQRNSLVNIKFKNKRQQADVKYKEDCLKTKFNSVYQEISDILGQKIKQLEQQLKTFRPKEQKLLQTIPGVGPLLPQLVLSPKSAISIALNNPNNWSPTLDLIPESTNPAPRFTAKDILAKEAIKSYALVFTTPPMSPSFAPIFFNLFSKRNDPKANPTKSP